MNTNFDEGKLAAYALGELSGDDVAKMQETLARSPEAQAYVEQTRNLARMLRDDFRAELHERKPVNVMPLPMPRSFWSDARWLSLGIAALLAVCAVVGAVLLGSGRGARELARRSAPDIQMEVETEQPFGDTDETAGSSFRSAAASPISSFALNVSHASYAAVRRFIDSGSLPPRDLVRVEEMINYFAPDEPPPSTDQPLSIATDTADCPWQPEHRLVRIAIAARQDADGSGLVARDAAVEVEFDPSAVAQYRLIGFAEGGAKHGEDIAPGHRVAALYEIAPAGANGRMLTVRLRYREPASDAWKLVENEVANRSVGFAAASADLKFAAAVAEFGMILQDAPDRGTATFQDVVRCADNGRGVDRDGERAAFIELVRKAERLTSG